MAAMVRVEAVRGYRELVAELGGDPVRLLRAAKIKNAAFDQPASFISFGAFVELLERSARDLACPDFGLRLAERQDIGILGPLAVAMRYSATVGEAMRCASKYIYVYNAAIGFSVRADDGGDDALFAFEVLSEHGPSCAQVIEHGVGITCRIVTHALGRTESPEPGLVAASRRRLAGHLPSPPGCAGGVQRPTSGGGDRSGRSRPAPRRAQRGIACVGRRLPERPVPCTAHVTSGPGPHGDRATVGHRRLRLRRGGRRPLDAPAHPAAASAGRGHDASRTSRTKPDGIWPGGIWPTRKYPSLRSPRCSTTASSRR